MADELLYDFLQDVEDINTSKRKKQEEDTEMEKILQTAGEMIQSQGADIFKSRNIMYTTEVPFIGQSSTWTESQTNTINTVMQHIKKHRYDEGIQELNDALTAHLEHKTKIEISELTLKRVQLEFNKRKFDAEVK